MQMVKNFGAANYVILLQAKMLFENSVSYRIAVCFGLFGKILMRSIQRKKGKQEQHTFVFIWNISIF